MADLLPPDYSDEFPREDDDFESLSEMDEDEERIERLLEEQERGIQEELEEEHEARKVAMSINPFSQNNNTAPWNSGSANKLPWESNSQGNSAPAWGTRTWGTTLTPQTTQQEVKNTTCPIDRKRIVVCDLLDCLYESWESNGRPNIMPRAVFDLKPKFDVWDKIASFAPIKIYVIFPAPELVPSLGNKSSSEAMLEYVAHSITTYLRIPRASCTVLKQMREGLPKERTLMSAVNDYGNVKDMVYVGTHTGRWGLSRRDIDAAKYCGIDYIDMYELLKGNYTYE
jgi:hypothetical protein